MKSSQGNSGTSARLARAVLGAPLRALALALAVALALSVAATRVEIDNGATVWLPAGDREVDVFDEFQARFGTDAFLLAVTAPVAARDPATLGELAATRDALAALPEVARVESALAEGGLRAELERDLALLDDALGRLPQGHGGAGLRALAAQGAAALALLPAGRDGAPRLSLRPLAGVLATDAHLALAVRPREGTTDAHRAALVGAVERVLETTGAALGPWDLAGTDVVTRDLDRGSRDSFARLFPLVLALMAGVLLAVLRSWRELAAIALAAALAGGGAVGALALAGRSLNLLVAVMPAVLMVVTTAYALHLLTAFQRQPACSDGSRSERAERWAAAMAETFRPCALTALTTAAGFGSLGLSRVPPVRDLGLCTAFGVLLAFALVFTLVPALLVLSPRVLPRPSERRWFGPERAARFAAWLGRRRVPIACAGVLALAVAGLGLARLEVESRVLGFFPPGHPLPESTARIEEELFGLTSLELWVEGPRAELASAEAMAALARFLDVAGADPLLAGSPVVWPFAGALQGLPPGERGALLAALSEGPAAPLRRYLWRGDGRVALRATLPARTDSSNAVHALVVRLRGELERCGLPEAIEARLTGSAPLLVRGQVLLLETMLGSFALALATVTLVLFAAFRSARLAALSLVPNVLPVVLTLGIMGLAGLPLDSATVTVAGIALGLVVDDTIHLLHAWRGARSVAGPATGPRLERALARVGPPIVTTSAAVALGFSAFAVSPFRPTRYFGLLIALTALLALACDLLLLPAALWLREEWRLRARSPHEGP